MLASILAASAMDKGFNVKMLRSSEIAESVRASWKPHSKVSEEDLMKSFSKPPVWR